MAAVKTVPVRKNADGADSERKKLFRSILFLLIIMAVIAGVVAGLYTLRKLLFQRNDRFLLRKIEVKSTGYWQDKGDLLASRLGVRENDNLFELDVRKLREKLKEIPSVDICEVYRTLPDTLNFRIVERNPRALVNNPSSDWVVDQNGVIFPRGESLAASASLPVVLGVSLKNVSPGSEVSDIKTAMDLLMLTIRSFPDISVVAINIKNPNKLDVYMRYRNQKSCRVFIPAGHKNMSFLLSALQSAILSAERRGDMRGTFDLSFDGTVIVR